MKRTLLGAFLAAGILVPTVMVVQPIRAAEPCSGKSSLVCPHLVETPAAAKPSSIRLVAALPDDTVAPTATAGEVAEAAVDSDSSNSDSSNSDEAAVEAGVEADANADADASSTTSELRIAESAGEEATTAESATSEPTLAEPAAAAPVEIEDGLPSLAGPQLEVSPLPAAKIQLDIPPSDEAREAIAPSSAAASSEAAADPAPTLADEAIGPAIDPKALDRNVPDLASEQAAEMAPQIAIKPSIEAAPAPELPLIEPAPLPEKVEIESPAPATKIDLVIEPAPQASDAPLSEPAQAETAELPAVQVAPAIVLEADAADHAWFEEQASAEKGKLPAAPAVAGEAQVEPEVAGDISAESEFIANPQPAADRDPAPVAAKAAAPAADMKIVIDSSGDIPAVDEATLPSADQPALKIVSEKDLPCRLADECPAAEAKVAETQAVEEAPAIAKPKVTVEVEVGIEVAAEEEEIEIDLVDVAAGVLDLVETNKQAARDAVFAATRDGFDWIGLGGLFRLRPLAGQHRDIAAERAPGASPVLSAASLASELSDRAWSAGDEAALFDAVAVESLLDVEMSVISPAVEEARQGAGSAIVQTLEAEQAILEAMQDMFPLAEEDAAAEIAPRIAAQPQLDRASDLIDFRALPAIELVEEVATESEIESEPAPAPVSIVETVVEPAAPAVESIPSPVAPEAVVEKPAVVESQPATLVESAEIPSPSEVAAPAAAPAATVASELPTAPEPEPLPSESPAASPAAELTSEPAPADRMSEAAEPELAPIPSSAMSIPPAVERKAEPSVSKPVGSVPSEPGYKAEDYEFEDFEPTAMEKNAPSLIPAA